ncbi:MAG TPA: hypothetical protein VJ647_03400, partial [Chitinophagaceae bacterium]|nr:hypothetical protein [Chitinophagaceae bacterium]
MKKYISSIAIAALLIACGGNDQKTAENTDQEMKPLVSRNTETFNRSFAVILSSYDALKDAFTDY